MRTSGTVVRRPRSSPRRSTGAGQKGEDSGVDSAAKEEGVNTYKVGYLVGGLATGSINRKLSRALTRLAPPRLRFTRGR